MRKVTITSLVHTGCVSLCWMTALVLNIPGAAVLHWQPEARQQPEKDLVSITYNNVRYAYTPRYEALDPPIAPEVYKRATAKQYTLYVRHNLRGFYPVSVPQPDEALGQIEVSATPGERASSWFMIYALRPLSGIHVAQTKPLMSSTKGINHIDTTQIKQIQFRTRRTSQRGFSYYIVPELLVTNTTLDVPAGESRGFWIQTLVPETAPAGTYGTTICVSAANAPGTCFPYRLCVLPFKLETPPQIVWAMYSNLHDRYTGRYDPPYTSHQYTETQLLKYLTDMKDYGINSVWDLQWYEESDRRSPLAYPRVDFAERTARLVVRAGLTGPLILFDQQEDRIGNRAGLAAAGLLQSPESGGEGLAEAYRRHLQALNEVVKAAGIREWYLQTRDEPPHGQKATLEAAHWEHRNARAVGVKTYVTCYPFDAVAKLIPHTDIIAGFRFAKSEEECRRYKALAQQHNSRLWLLGASVYQGMDDGGAAYERQEGGLMPDRFLAGFLFFKTGVSGHISWTWQYTKGNPWIDWGEGGTYTGKDWSIVYPACKITDTSVTTSTLQWEGIREGIYDYKYAYTMVRWAERAQSLGYQADSTRALKTLEAVMQTVPWLDDYRAGDSYLHRGNLSDDVATQCRTRIAAEIVSLKRTVEGRKRRAARQEN